MLTIGIFLLTIEHLCLLTVEPFVLAIGVSLLANPPALASKNPHFPRPQKRAVGVKKSPFSLWCPVEKWGFFDSNRGRGKWGFWEVLNGVGVDGIGGIFPFFFF